MTGSLRALDCARSAVCVPRRFDVASCFLPKTFRAPQCLLFVKKMHLPKQTILHPFRHMFESHLCSHFRHGPLISVAHHQCAFPPLLCLENLDISPITVFLKYVLQSFCFDSIYDFLSFTFPKKNFTLGNILILGNILDSEIFLIF